MASTVMLRCNFFDDVRTDLLDALSSLGIALPADTPVHHAMVEYCHLEHRLIHPHARKVVWSKKLRARLLVVADDQRAHIETIAMQLEKGIDVTPRMTRNILKPGYNDGLLTDWKIHHLHLSNRVGSDGFVERGGPLLFVFITENVAYLLDLLNHKAFEEQDLIEIIHEEWPEAIASSLAQGAIPGSLSPVLGPEGKKTMRRKMITMTQMKDGTIYCPPGGGVMLSGHSFEAVGIANHFLNRIRPAEDWVKENADKLATRIGRLAGQNLSGLDLKFCTRLTLQTGRVTVREMTTNTLITPVPPEDGREPTFCLVTVTAQDAADATP